MSGSELEPEVEVKVAPSKKKGSSKVKEEVTPSVWFGKKTKMYGRPVVYCNEATDETDVLSIAIHSGIGTDDELTEFMTTESTLRILAEAMKCALTHSTKINATADGTVITRYYAEEYQLPEVRDVRITYKPSLQGGPPRWAIRGFLILSICTLLDETQRSRVIGKPTPGSPQEKPKAPMVTFHGVRRQLYDLPIAEIETAEREATTGSSIATVRELLCIRKMLHQNAEYGIMTMNARVSQAEDNSRAEKMIRLSEILKHKTESDRTIASLISARAMDQATTLVEQNNLRARAGFAVECEAAKYALTSAWQDGIIKLLSQLALSLSKCVIAPVIRMESVADLPPDDIKIELEDAMLEIARLKNDVRTKALPKPKAKRKGKDPDIRLATEVDIRSSVRSHLSGGSGTSVSTIASRARKRAGLSDISPGSRPPMSSTDLRLLEEKEIEMVRKLKALSRAREEDLRDAEWASEQLTEVVDCLSTMLTQIDLTIDDICTRRTTIMNHMRSLALHSRGITSIIREKPYMLSLARGMNHERRPIVQLTPLRALINVAAANHKKLKEVELITLESAGGLCSVMTLEEAAESAVQDEEEWSAPDLTPVMVDRTPAQQHVLTRATLRRHAVSDYGDS